MSIALNLNTIECNFEEVKTEASIILSNKKAQEIAFDKLNKIEPCYKKMNILIELYNQGKHNYKGSITAQIDMVLRNHIPDPDICKVGSNDDRQMLSGLFTPIKKACEDLRAELNPEDPRVIARKEAIEKHNYELENLLRDELNLLKNSASFELFLKELSAEYADKNLSPTVYFMYAWPSEHRKQEEGWIQPFLSDLKGHLDVAGIKRVKLDYQSNRTGRDIGKFMEGAKNDDYVIMFGSRSLKDKYEGGGINCVATEFINVIRKREADLRKGLYRVFPLILSGTLRDDYPPEYERFTAVRDFRTSGYLATFQMLYLELFNLAPERFLDSLKKHWDQALEGQEEAKQITQKLGEIRCKRQQIKNTPLPSLSHLS